jgi:hypothetical protein
MIWIILSAILYAITCAIALFLICTSEVEVSKDSFFDIRNIGVALFWPLVLAGHAVWMAGKRIFKEKSKTQHNVVK